MVSFLETLEFPVKHDNRNGTEGVSLTSESALLKSTHSKFGKVFGV